MHRFVRVLRLFGLRVSVSEAMDAMRAAAQPGVLGRRETLREALRLTLVKDRRDDELFDELFAAFFSLRPVHQDSDGHGHSHEHDDLTDTGELESYTVSDEPSETPQQGHSHGKPADIRDYFDQQDLAQRYNLHQEANKLDLAAMTEEIVLSKDGAADATRGPSVQLETERLHGAGIPGQLAAAAGHPIDTTLTVAQQDALLGWLADDTSDDPDDPGPGALRRGPAGVIDNLPELLRRHLDRLAELQSVAVESAQLAERARAEAVDEHERTQLEEALRRVGRSLHGALTSRKRATPRGRVHPARTMRRNMRYDGVPFRPVTVTRAEDRPRLVILTDVSLSVRATARFTLHLVHGLQSLFGQVRSFAFVDEPTEITELFTEHPLERALGLVFDGLPAGGLLDVDANSDYGRTFELLLAEHAPALNRRTTLLVLGDGRGNGNPSGLAAFEEITRRVRETIWLTPEPRFSWGLGSCDLPLYAEYCARVQVVADLAGLERTARRMATEVTGR
ncbi:VWA domain-containing protein [Streptomyces sp. HUAS TT20]|uniref:VWA domain-containing protein n=1 Tax=Streptomyces sp. HUAS TT20 TaxID=3447509 RepID=UPI0021D84AD7|nr:VWA domain-containing protein [Streptomyces sp. HUAS 15-9]UXY28712.1 VWA domain-containing protein [Streptomyces sp. HUAS 15-9]